MNSGVIILRYARALLLYGRQRGKEEVLYENATTLLNNVGKYPAVKDALSNPVLPMDKKKQLIHALIGAHLDEVFSNFIQLLIKNRRDNMLQSILLNYQHLYLQEHGIVEVELTTAVPIDEATMKRMTNRIENRTHRKILMQNHVDPGIIGGYVMTWDTYRYDASVNSSLRRIKNDLFEKMNN
ncbi:MAG: F0F1 ATP synthase subunit delta [Tannerellaceae bacterium]|nr:F0F1 ATP synthase subunit delta [Tannerellaceae bacterium]